MSIRTGGGYVAHLAAESFKRASFRFRGFLFAILGWRGGFQGIEQARGNRGYLIDGCPEGPLIGLRWVVYATNFSDKLQRSGMNFLGSHRRIEVEERPDIPAHFGGRLVP